MRLKSLTRARVVWRYARRVIHWTWIAAARLALLIGLLVALGDGTIHDGSLRARVTALARDYLFDYVAWEVDTLWGKARQELFGVQPYLDDAEGRALLIDYLDRVAQVQRIEEQIDIAYADPAIVDPEAATADLRAERDALRRDLAEDQPLVEGIIESQVSAVLADEGFARLGQVIPPVSMHFSELPGLVVVSPRDRIAFEVDLNINALTAEARNSLEMRIDSTLGVSSLVTPLGGLSLYPSMIDETSRLARAFEVTAHEWVHHYLAFFPLGLEYTVRPETRILNETTATFFGREIAQKVMARYYADLPQPVYPSFLAPPDDPAAPLPGDPPRDPDAPEPFDYYALMDRTRREVDFLLWQGRITAAETLMEYRRREFVRHGYLIRKLNQAYFAFHGGYQGEPGAGGSDPTGPAVEELRALSPALKDWLITLRSITTRADLLAAVESARAGE